MLRQIRRYRRSTGIEGPFLNRRSSPRAQDRAMETRGFSHLPCLQLPPIGLGNSPVRSNDIDLNKPYSHLPQNVTVWNILSGESTRSKDRC
jgi:hypothetical protein